MLIWLAINIVYVHEAWFAFNKKACLFTIFYSYYAFPNICFIVLFYSDKKKDKFDMCKDLMHV